MRTSVMVVMPPPPPHGLRMSICSRSSPLAFSTFSMSLLARYWRNELAEVFERNADPGGEVGAPDQHVSVETAVMVQAVPAIGPLVRWLMTTWIPGSNRRRVGADRRFRFGGYPQRTGGPPISRWIGAGG